jgi:hypothetical protein
MVASAVKPAYRATVTRLLIAAGGGGDAIAAAIIHHATAGGDPDVMIATYAWDRLLIDPLPGPRSPDDFAGLTRISEHSYAVTADSWPIPPAGSTLPRLSADLGIPLIILDPRRGARGLADQVGELANHLSVEMIELVDVGGDILAYGDEPNLRTPLADALVLAACSRLSLPVTVAIAGPGVDGELPETLVLSRLASPTPALQLTNDHVQPYLSILDWHPTEATTLVAAAALGIRGTVEIRDAAIAVRLSNTSSQVYAQDGRAAAADNPLTTALADSASLTSSEEAVRRICGFSEIDYERTKAKILRTPTPPTGHKELGPRLESYSRSARERGVDYITYRRLAEACGASISEVRAVASPNHNNQLIPLWRTDRSEAS